jgi:hypothetical protein
VSNILVVKGRYANRTFVPDGPLPPEEGPAELVIHTTADSTDSREGGPLYLHGTKPSHEEFLRLLAQLPVHRPLPNLPPDFSRADIYDDHD